MVMVKNPVKALRDVVQDLLDNAKFDYSVGQTRQLVGKAQKVLVQTQPAVAHEHAAGVFKYDPAVRGFVQVSETEAMDKEGRLRPQYRYLFTQPPELVPH